MKHHVDVHVGQNIRRRRWMLGMTQKQLGDAVGIKFQQIQKYETGTNRVSASRLYEISQAMDVPVSFFFADLEGTAAEDTAAAETPKAANDQIPAEVFYGKEAVDLLRCYYRWPEEQRQYLYELTKSISKAAA